MNQAGSLRSAILPAVVLLPVLALIVFRLLPPAIPATPPVSDNNTLLTITGETMGTDYRVLVPAVNVPEENHRQLLANAIAARLYHLDRELLSTYAPGSELSRVNAMAAGQSMPVSRELAAVIGTAIEVNRQSAGAFDITIKPLVDLWGFGPYPQDGKLPGADAVASALEQMGMDRIYLDSGARTLTKTAPVTLDLSAIAKGFAVDEIAGLLEQSAMTDYLVEIGGEVSSRGNRPGGEPWRLGIEAPAAGESSLFQALRSGSGKLALAGSGNYRNFFVVDGRRYSHTINPVTGRPVSHDLASVTVVAESAMLADAWATALLVMGPDAGMKRANELQLATYFIEAGASGFRAFHSEAFNRFLPDDLSED